MDSALRPLPSGALGSPSRALSVAATAGRNAAILDASLGAAETCLGGAVTSLERVAGGRVPFPAISPSAGARIGGYR